MKFTEAKLELAIIELLKNEGYPHVSGETISRHVEPFPGGRLDPKSLAVNGIDPFHPFRLAVPEAKALQEEGIPAVPLPPLPEEHN